MRFGCPPSLIRTRLQQPVSVTSLPFPHSGVASVACWPRPQPWPRQQQQPAEHAAPTHHLIKWVGDCFVMATFMWHSNSIWLSMPFGPAPSGIVAPFLRHCQNLLFITCPPGLDPAKIRIVPEGLDTTLWDPARHNTISVSRLDLRQAAGPLAPPAASLSGNITGPVGPTLSAPHDPANKPYSGCHTVCCWVCI
jgi:hypothetical protein